MASIKEAEGVRPEDTQLAEFFDFNKATEPQVDAPSIHQSGTQCPSHPGDSCLCHGSSVEDSTDLAQIEQAAYQGEHTAEDYSQFQDWIPRFVQPDEPCGYCRNRNLQCFLSYGKLTCTACDTLFRPCSFAAVNNQDNSHDHVPSNMGIIDTLHPVTEDVCQEQGALTSIKLLKSKSAATDDKKSGTRFSRAAVKVLKDWVDTHQENPYPSEEEKDELSRLTGLRHGQVNTWLANARRRGKALRGRPRGVGSAGVRQSSPMGVPSRNIEVMSWENMNPLERWKHSPPTNEPAPINAIYDALERKELPPLETSPPSPLGYTGFGSSREESGSHSISNRRAPSMTSLEQITSQSGTSSAAWSGSHDSFGSFSSFGSGLNGKRDGRRRRKGAHSLLKKQAQDKTKRMFQCTFCTDTFKSKYDWTRHEKSLHLSLEKFICCPLGPEITDPKTGGKICAYCLSPDPTRDHLETHGHQACVEKGFEARTFYRKDHLRQHLRLMHGSQLVPHMEEWKVEAKFINSRCGFCSQRFTTWQERVDHIAAHFKDGKKMIEWKGCRGFDPSVAATVLNAMPPYLIGVEQTSPNPYSATCPKQCMTMAAHAHNGGPPATCWEILTVRLGRFAKEQADKGVLLTDELIQHQARVILYDDPDPWNQTAADNPEWLDLFKRAHGLDLIPNAIGGAGANVPDDLEVYGDLGMRIPFGVQLGFSKYQGLANDIVKKARNERPAEEKNNQAGEAPETAPTRTHQRYSRLQVPFEKAKQFETVPAPYPESGVRGEIIHTKDMITEKDLYQSDTLCDPSTTEPSYSDSSGATTRTNSSTGMLPPQQAGMFSDSVLSEYGYTDERCIMSGLGFGGGNSEGPSYMFGQSNHSTYDTSNAQSELNALNAALAAATTSSAPPDARLCCTDMGQCSHQDQLLSHLGFLPSNLDTFGKYIPLNTEPLANAATTAEAGIPSNGYSGGDPMSTMPLMDGMISPSFGTATTADPTPFASTTTPAFSENGGMVNDVNMGDFDFNDLNFSHDAGFGNDEFGFFDTVPTTASQSAPSSGF